MSSGALRRRARSLGFRINAWYAAVLVLVCSLAALAAGISTEQSLEHEQELLLRAELGEQRGQLSSLGMRLGEFEALVSDRQGRSGVRWFARITDDSNRTLLFSAKGFSPEFSAGDLTPSTESRIVVSRGSGGRDAWRVKATRVGNLWLQVGMHDAPRKQLDKHLRHGIWVLLALTVVLGALGGVVVSRRALAPLRNLTFTSRRVVRSGDLSLRVPRSGSNDELDELSALFNRVLEQNQRLVEGMRAALDNVAHDLRTPLSRLRSSAELALQHEHDAARMREALAEVVEESEHLLDMLNTLMDISEAETGVMKLDLTHVELATAVRQAVEMYQHVADERQISMTVDFRAEPVVRGDRRRILQVIANLIDNALKYTNPGGEVRIELGSAEGKAELVVSDTGIGIEAVHVERIWQRLYRAEPSRTRPGLGLGLSLVKAVVEAHGGSVRVTSTPREGSTFVVQLPLEH
jgi:signal transduction histidine kinase